MNTSAHSVYARITGRIPPRLQPVYGDGVKGLFGAMKNLNVCAQVCSASARSPWLELPAQLGSVRLLCFTQTGCVRARERGRAEEREEEWRAEREGGKVAGRKEECRI